MSTTTIDPTQVSDDEVRGAALYWVNKARAKYGLEPCPELPKGKRGDAGKCAIARGALGLSDGSATIKTWGGRDPGERQDGTPLPAGLNFAREGEIVNYPITPLVQEFMNRFDDGKFPDLVE